MTNVYAINHYVLPNLPHKITSSLWFKVKELYELLPAAAAAILTAIIGLLLLAISIKNYLL